MNQSLPSLFDYTDVKQYLREYRAVRKEIDPGFTNIYICFALGQKNSKGYFNNVINGRVKIGPTIAERFIELLKLNTNEAAYFHALITYSQSTDPNKQEQAFRQMIRHNRTESTELSDQSLAYYLDWKHAVVRALLDVYDFDGNSFKELASQILYPISAKKMEKSFKLLKELDLIAENDDGYWKPTSSAISHSSEIQRELLIRYQAKSFVHSAAVVTDKKIRPQKATSMTLSISEDTYLQIKERVDALKEEIRTLVSTETEDSERLYQLNIHLFPQSVNND